MNACLSIPLENIGPKIKYKTGNHLLLLEILEAIESKYNRLYCLASRQRLKELMSIHYGLNLSLRTISRYIHRLREEGLIEIIYRKKRHEDGTIRQRSTMFKILQNGWRFLKGHTITVMRRLRRTGLTKSSIKEPSSIKEEDYNITNSLEKMEKLKKRYRLEELPTTFEGFKAFLESL